jgi:hypothetical protein
MRLPQERDVVIDPAAFEPAVGDPNRHETGLDREQVSAERIRRCAAML